MGRHKPPNVPYVEAFHRGKRQRPTAIMIRSSETPSTQGSALAIASYWHRPTSPHDSCHYVVDEAETYRCVDDRVIAGHWHCSDKGTIRINVCSELMSETRFWDDSQQLKVLDRTADLVAQLMLAYKIRNVYLDDTKLRKWQKWRIRRRGGLIMHVEGAWPNDAFSSNVRAKISQRRSRGFTAVV